MPVCRKLGTGIVPFSPFGGGAPTGVLRTPADLPENDHRRNIPWFSAENVERKVEAALARLGEDRRRARGHGREENSMATNLDLSATEVAALDAISPSGAREQASAPAARNWEDGVSALLGA